MNLCACIGAIGNDPHCPCKMEELGLKCTITETYINKEIWNCLSDEDKNTINDLKQKAFGIWWCNKNKESV